MYHVFLADDEPWALMALKNLIQWSDYGFAVSGEAQDGRQALERIERMGPDLIISDIRMPGMDGLALLQTIREKRWRAEVLLVSGYTDFEYARKALLYGCVGYLVKPVQEKELLEYLEKVRNILNEKYKADAPGGQKEENADGYRSEKLLVQNMVSFIQEHFAQGLTLQMLAGEFNRNESYISSLIKKKTGKGFGEHLMEARIQKAQEYLRTTNDSLEAIAAKVGYPDYYYFTKVYKKATGISPAAYRRQL
ncbi:MAG: response regulator [Lachnospiraceae bacterium]|jgi:two-component system response regulator YesN|nr:response regulator [Lachnospiraceae bacterium]